MPTIQQKNFIVTGQAPTPYWRKVRGILPANQIQYLRLNETAGAVAVDSSARGNNGAYTGVDLANAPGPDGVLCPFFDGLNDYVNLISANLLADLNLAEGTFAVWAKVANAGVWTDGAFRAIASLRTDPNNRFYVAKSGTPNNTIQFLYRIAGGGPVANFTASSTDWMHLAFSWSTVGGIGIFYFNGAAYATTVPIAGAWTGAVSIALLGAETITTNVFHGWLSNSVIWSAVLTPAQILALATV